MQTEYCSNCGAELESGDQFCAECGEPVEGGGEATRYTAGQEPAPAQTGDTTFAAITHILGLVTWILGPLIVFLVTEDAYVKENARNALNWQIMFTIYMLVSFVLLFLLVGIVFLILLPLVDILLCIIAAIKASEGETWKYPVTPNIV